MDTGKGLAIRMMEDQARRAREYRLRVLEEQIELDRQRDAIERRAAERERLTREARARSERIAAYEAKHGDPRRGASRSVPARRSITPPADQRYSAWAGGLEFVGPTQAEADRKAAAWRAQTAGREVRKSRRDQSALADGHERMQRR